MDLAGAGEDAAGAVEMDPLLTSQKQLSNFQRKKIRSFKLFILLGNFLE